MHKFNDMHSTISKQNERSFHVVIATMKPNKKDIYCLELLLKAKPALWKELSKDKRLVTLISQCCANLLDGRFKVSPPALKKLKKHKGKILALAGNRTPVSKKIELIQKGGFLRLLIPAAIGLLSTLFGK